MWWGTNRIMDVREPPHDWCGSHRSPHPTQSRTLSWLQKEWPIGLKIPWNISLKYWHMVENHDAVRTSPHPTTFANIRGMLLQHPSMRAGMKGLIRRSLIFYILTQGLNRCSTCRTCKVRPWPQSGWLALSRQMRVKVAYHARRNWFQIIYHDTNW